MSRRETLVLGCPDRLTVQHVDALRQWLDMADAAVWHDGTLLQTGGTGAIVCRTDENIPRNWSGAVVKWADFMEKPAAAETHTLVIGCPAPMSPVDYAVLRQVLNLPEGAKVVCQGGEKIPADWTGAVVKWADVMPAFDVLVTGCPEAIDREELRHLLRALKLPNAQVQIDGVWQACPMVTEGRVCLQSRGKEHAPVTARQTVQWINPPRAEAPSQAPTNPLAARGAAFVALGYAMQSGATTVDDLVQLAHAAGLSMRFEVRHDG